MTEIINRFSGHISIIYFIRRNLRHCKICLRQNHTLRIDSNKNFRYTVNIQIFCQRNNTNAIICIALNRLIVSLISCALSIIPFFWQYSITKEKEPKDTSSTFAISGIHLLLFDLRNLPLQIFRQWG